MADQETARAARSPPLLPDETLQFYKRSIMQYLANLADFDEKDRAMLTIYRLWSPNYIPDVSDMYEGYMHWNVVPVLMYGDHPLNHTPRYQQFIQNAFAYVNNNNTRVSVASSTATNLPAVSPLFLEDTGSPMSSSSSSSSSGSVEWPFIPLTNMHSFMPLLSVPAAPIFLDDMGSPSVPSGSSSLSSSPSVAWPPIPTMEPGVPFVPLPSPMAPMASSTEPSILRWKRAIRNYLRGVTDVDEKVMILFDMYQFWNRRNPGEILTEAKLMQDAYAMADFLRHPHPYDTDPSFQHFLQEVYTTLPNRWKQVQEIVKEKTMGEYVWDRFCSLFNTKTSDPEFTKLVQFAHKHGIPNTETMNKEQLCDALRQLPAQFYGDAAQCPLDDDAIDIFTQERVRDVPVYRRHKLGNACYDVLELEKYLAMPPKFDRDTHVPLPHVDPTTQQPLTDQDITDIHTHYHQVQEMLHAKGLFYERIRSNPILSRDQLTAMELDELWTKLSYPVALTRFMAASNDELDNMWNEMLHYDTLKISRAEDDTFKKATTPQTKIQAMLPFFRRIRSSDDTTRYLAVSVALNHNIVSTATMNSPTRMSPTTTGAIGGKRGKSCIKKKRTPFKKRGAC